MTNTTNPQIDKLIESIKLEVYRHLSEVASIGENNTTEYHINDLYSLFAHQLKLAKIEAKIESSEEYAYWVNSKGWGEEWYDDNIDGHLKSIKSELTKQKEEIENARN